MHKILEYQVAHLYKEVGKHVRGWEIRRRLKRRNIFYLDINDP